MGRPFRVSFAVLLAHNRCRVLFPFKKKLNNLHLYVKMALGDSPKRKKNNRQLFDFVLRLKRAALGGTLRAIFNAS